MNDIRYAGLVIAAIAMIVAIPGFTATSAVAASLGGSWSGNGFVKPSSGQRERVRCRVTYTRLTKKVYSVSARCASSSATLSQSGEVLMVRPNLFVGDFYNQQFDIRGRIRIRISGRSQSVTLSSSSASGRLRLRKR